jgi:hypothetical protein
MYSFYDPLMKHMTIQAHPCHGSETKSAPTRRQHVGADFKEKDLYEERLVERFFSTLSVLYDIINQTIYLTENCVKRIKFCCDFRV